MNGYEKRKQHSRQKIREAAKRLFARKGYHDTAMSEIAREAQTSPATIYNHYQSKESLLESVVRETIDERWQTFLAMQQSGLSFREKMEALISEKIAQEHKDSELFKIIPLDVPVVQSVLEEYHQQKTVPMFQEMVRQGKAEGSLAQDLSEDAVLFYLELFRRSQNHPDFLDPANSALRKGLVHLFFYGLLGKTK